MSNNGSFDPEAKTPEAKTDEQIKQELIAEFSKDPTLWIRTEELVFAVKRSEQGLQYFLGKGAINELIVAKYQMDAQIDYAVAFEKQQEITKKQGHIIKPGSMLDFVRRKK